MQIEALPEVARAVGDKIDVYVDGGVRYGADIFKCLALGAKMVSNSEIFVLFD